jgi:phosphoesterase RecJ-like protein
MTVPTPFHRRDAVDEIVQLLGEATSVILTTHVNADGDGAGSQAALAAWLRSRGKGAWIVNPTPLPRNFHFLLPDPDWTLDARSTRAREVLQTADLGVVLDTGEVPRIGTVHGLLEGLPTAVIDHHPPGPDPIPGTSLRDAGACATGELVYDVLSTGGEPWPPEVVQGLYVAILADTGSFRFSNASPRAHLLAAELIQRGASPETLYRRVFGNVPLRKLRLLQTALRELNVDASGSFAWMTVPPEAYDDLDARAEDLEGFVDYPRDLEGVEVAILFRETARGFTKVSFRSNGDRDVNELARRFGGGGHVKASGALVERPLAQVREEVLAAVREALREERTGP